MPQDVTKKTRILVVAHDAGMYGAQHSLLDILRFIDKERFEILVVVPTSGPFTDELRLSGIGVIVGLTNRWIFHPRVLSFGMILRRPWLLLNHPYLRAFLSAIGAPFRVGLLSSLVLLRRVDLIYSNTATVLDGAIVARLCKLPHVWHIREAILGNADVVSPIGVNWISSFVLRYANVVVVNSERLKQLFFGDCSVRNVRVIHNSIDVAIFCERSDVSRSFPVRSGVRVIGTCGAIHERKDVLSFVKAAYELCKMLPNLHFVIIGQGHSAYVELVKREIVRLGLTDCVHLLGYRNDIPALMSAIDILVSSSIVEPFGRTIIEAMAAGKPVVATRSGGPEEIIVDGVNGFLVNVGDDLAIANKVFQILNNETLYDSMSRAAIERVRNDFNLRKKIKEIERVFDDALTMV